MAISRIQWNKAKAYYHAGKSLKYISDKLKMNKSTISRKAKKESWEKGKTQPLKDALVAVTVEEGEIKEKKATIKQQLTTLDDYEIKIIENITTEEAKVKALIHSTAALAVVRQNEILTKGTKQVMLKVAQYDSVGRRVAEEYEPYDIPLSSSDIKDVVDSTDKASITLGLNQRHANSQMTITNQKNDLVIIATPKEFE